MQQPMDFYPEYTVVPPLDIAREQRSALRSSANFAGLFMLLLIASFQLVFPLFAFLLAAVGLIPGEGLSQPYLGLDNTHYLLVYSVVYIFSMGTPLLLLTGRRGFNPFLPAKPVHAGVAGLGILGGVGICMLSNIITSYILMFFSEFGIEAAPPPQLLENTAVSFVLNLFVMAVLPALLEELLFRGCLLRLLRPYGDWFAVVVSAVFFGLMHGNLRQIPFATIVGLVLGYLYVATNNIWVPILVHFINNAISVVTEYMSFSLTEDQAGSLYVTVILRLIAVGLLAIGLLFGFFRNQLKTKKTSTDLPFGQRLFSVLTSPVLMGSGVVFIWLMIMEM